MDSIIIGTRGSKLALWQANFIKSKLENKFNLKCEIKIIKTTGDKILDTPLAKIGGKGLFTKELEEMLLKKDITIAVHSLKDVPVDLIDGLTLASITSREDIRDCFLSHKYKSLDELPKNAKIGTTSLRRSMQLKALCNDFDTISLRGNVQTRLQRLERGEFDAIILAKAGVNRLGINNDDVAYIVPLDSNIMIPAMGQGALGIECRNDCAIIEYLKQLNCNKSEIECTIERDFVRYLNGGCQVPIGVNAIYNDGQVELNAIIGLPNGKKIIRENINGNVNENLSLELYNRVCKRGAKEILVEALEMIETLEGFSQ